MKELFSPKEVSQILNVHEKTVRRYLREGTIKGQKIGGSWKVGKDVLKKYLASQPKKDMDEQYRKLKKQGRAQVCLRLDIEVKNAKEGHQYAKLFMELISNYTACNFQYEMDGQIAQYLLCGCIQFLREALNILEESGACYDTNES